MGIRIRKRQGGLFEGGPATRHFALVSNIWDWKAGVFRLSCDGSLPAFPAPAAMLLSGSGLSVRARSRWAHR
jgi:hypothetical protein